MKKVLDNDIAKELLTILAYLDDKFINNLPSNFLKDLAMLAADSTKDFFINTNKKLNEQNLSENCKNWLSILYYQSADEEIKAFLLNNWINNDVNSND